MPRPPSRLNLEPREKRAPLYVKVVTQPALDDCWAVNISKSGVGLMATRGARGPKVDEGSELDLELDLPDSGSRIRARGAVIWRHDGHAGVDGAAAVSLGVVFRHVSADHRLEIARYVMSGQFHVAVAFATAQERAAIEAGLSAEVRLHFGDTPEQIDELLARGDVAALAVCGAELPPGLQLIDLVATRIGVNERLDGLDVLHDLAPRIIAVARREAMPLMEPLNSGKVFRVVRSLESGELTDSALKACRERGVRAEQRRVALRLERSLLQARALDRSAAAIRTAAAQFVFKSEAMRRVLDLARVAAPHPVAVLLQGETGTGKEILARTIHELSDRVSALLVVQDCGALTETLLDSELFGHVKGAFTGATADHPGMFVLADGGTIFLDEIENTTPNLQARLLRVIETGEVRPVGGTQVRKVDVRVIAASNRDLRAEMRAGRFRPDLYYRLSSFPIWVPPLRQRMDDVEPLARHFLKAACAALGRDACTLADDALELLEGYDWPGNARELKNAMERAALLARGGEEISADSFPANLFESEPGAAAAAAPQRGSLKQRLDVIERDLLRAVLERHHGVLRRAARELAIDPVTLGRKVRRLGLLPLAPRTRRGSRHRSVTASKSR